MTNIHVVDLITELCETHEGREAILNARDLVAKVRDKDLRFELFVKQLETALVVNRAIRKGEP
jgi:hypothetical protein